MASLLLAWMGCERNCLYYTIILLNASFPQVAFLAFKGDRGVDILFLCCPKNVKRGCFFGWFLANKKKHMHTVKKLSRRKCKPHPGSEAPLGNEEIKGLHERLDLPWEVVDGKKLKYEFFFDTFADAMVFVNDVAAVADDENHHPNIIISCDRVVIECITNAVAGLTENDFIIARKSEMMFK